MKEKIAKTKEYVIKHKKQIIIGTGVAIAVIIGAKFLYKKSQEVELYDNVEEITGGVIDNIAVEK